MRNGRRWQSNQIKGLAQLPDVNRYPVSFVIKGNHEDPNGNAVPYQRMTQRSKYKDPAALRYLCWKIYVLQAWQTQVRQPFPCEADGYYRLDVVCFFLGERHADPENVRKGIQDALFPRGDKHVKGLVDFGHVKSAARVHVTVDRLVAAK